MKILLNGFPVTYPISGVGQYTLQLGKALESLLGAENVFWFGNNALSSHREGTASIDRVQLTLKNNLRKIPGLKPIVHIWRGNQFRSYTRRIRPSLYHETNYVPFPFEYGPTIITVYDLSFVRHPNWHPTDRVKYFEKYCLRQLSHAEAIITISEFSKKEILNLLNLDPAKIYVTPLGVDRNFTPGEKKIQGLPERYILFLGNLEPRKNLPTLVEAYRSLPEDVQGRYPLVIAGARAWHTKELKETFRPLQGGGGILLAGYVPQAQLPDLYRGACLFVYPSFYEGFGLPVLEAMACGVPVITSNASSLPEVVGDAGTMVNPYRVEELKEAIHLALSDEQLWKEMRRKGLDRAKRFSWAKCARETLNVYNEVSGRDVIPK